MNGDSSPFDAVRSFSTATRGA